MIDRSDLEDEYFQQLVEDTMRLLVKERSGGLSEVTGRPGEVNHHILGRNKPRGFKGLPDELKVWWPHAPMNCMILTRSEHEGAHKYTKMMRVLLLNLLLLRHGDRIWEGKSYREWLNEPPFVEFL